MNKRILFFTAFALTFFACSGSDDNEPSLPTSSSSNSVGDSSSSSSSLLPQSSSSLSGSVFCVVNDHCGELPAEVCFGYGGYALPSCPGTYFSSSANESSSSSINEPSSSSTDEPSSSSSLGLVSCVFDEHCYEVTAEACSLFEFEIVESCPFAFTCNMNATTGTVNMPITPAPTATCNGDAVSNSVLTWTPQNYIPTEVGSLVVSVTARLGSCQGMTAKCASITISEPTLTCDIPVATGTVGMPIPTPTVNCSGIPVTTGLTWTPGNLIPTEAGDIAVSVSAGSGVCIGKMAECGSVAVETFDQNLYERKPDINPNGIYLKQKPVDADGNEYEAVLIGTQVWMAENLNLKIEGSKCRPLTGTTPLAQDECDSYPYGRVYTWTMARDICPDGWHLPSLEELNTLFDFADCEMKKRGNDTIAVDAGKILRSTKDYESGGYGWYSVPEANKSTDRFGFSALPGGSLSKATGTFATNHNNGYFWTATEVSEKSQVYVYYFPTGADAVLNSRDYNKTDNLISVRCVKDWVEP